MHVLWSKVPAMSSTKKGRAVSSAPTVNGFTAIRIRWHRLPFVRYVYVKQHHSKKSDTEMPSDRTLFVANCSGGEEEMIQIFGIFGNIEKIKLGRFAQRRHGYPGNDSLSDPIDEGAGEKHAHIIFSEAAALRRVFQCNDVLEVDQGSAEPTDFVSMAQAAYQSRKVSAADLQQSAESYLAAFDERTEAEKKARKEGLIDDDGFQLVTYKRKNRHVDPSTVEAPQKKKKELVDFYRFQIREKKREQVATLRQRFEEDKKRIELMRQQRKFRPY